MLGSGALISPADLFSQDRGVFADHIMLSIGDMVSAQALQRFVRILQRPQVARVGCSETPLAANAPTKTISAVMPGQEKPWDYASRLGSKVHVQRDAIGLIVHPEQIGMETV